MNVNWITLLGPELVDKLGGRHALERQLAPPLRLLLFGNENVGIQAGDEPDLGNIDQGNRLDAYRQVASLLAPVWASDARIREIPVDGFNDEENVAWLYRFQR